MSINNESERQYYYIGKVKEIISEKAKEKGSPLTYHIQTFGCQMNARDSEKLAGVLEQAGFVEVDNEQADFVIYNNNGVNDEEIGRIIKGSKV